MSGRLPIFVNPLLYARRGMSVFGSLAIADMERLREFLVEPYSTLDVSLDFGCDGSHCFLKGKVEGQVNIICQRCLKPFSMKVDHQILLGMIESEAEIPQLREGEEPLIVENDELRLQDLVEDELLLLLPMVAMHDPGKCHLGFEADDEGEQEQEGEKKNPFAQLANLKKDSV